MRRYAWIAVLVIGCGPGAPGIVIPTIDPSGIAKRAMTEMDKNNDGQLDADELKASPGLKSASAAFDANRDGKLSRDEIAGRFTKYIEANAGLVGSGCTILLDGQPLVDADVKFVPEACMGPSRPVGTGKTDGQGHTSLQTEGQPVVGLFCGLYRVEVIKAGVPAKYNEKSELGCEVPPGSFSRGDISLTFRLTSK